jgi:hypothetical protein
MSHHNFLPYFGEECMCSNALKNCDFIPIVSVIMMLGKGVMLILTVQHFELASFLCVMPEGSKTAAWMHH